MESRELATRIKYAGGQTNRWDKYYLGKLEIILYNMRKTKGVEEYPKTVVIKLKNEHVIDFVYNYTYKKIGNKGVASMLIDKRYRIIDRILNGK
jgi:hypothetical protein